ncbi:orotidine-5'-phosphate decarboxylase [Fastidiosibacter lacustris]|uniref:orotidine-5'-phosphate decarboxylase n=1 Tax=Fastidiosibacter lacustris TaxID=2056695 RepID=UPI000E344969|nr:orotidine-5'-phosphate decarboxylase [Fastidiosibacter lacustris]
MRLSFSKSIHPVSQKLADIVIRKKTNLALSVDMTDSKSLLHLVEQTADHIAVLKTHIDIISDFTPKLTQILRKLADEAGFLIFEDRKFADIGHTVCHQVKDGIYHIAQWADIINAHLLPGVGIIEGLKKGCQGRDIGLLLLAQMSSNRNLFSDAYTAKTVEIAERNKDFIMGFIAQQKLSQDNDLVTMTPGVSFSSLEDDLGQNYHTPQYVIKEKKSDIIIVGRGIYGAQNPKQAAIEYQQQAWQFLNNI